MYVYVYIYIYTSLFDMFVTYIHIIVYIYIHIYLWYIYICIFLWYIPKMYNVYIYEMKVSWGSVGKSSYIYIYKQASTASSTGSSSSSFKKKNRSLATATEPPAINNRAPFWRNICIFRRDLLGRKNDWKKSTGKTWENPLPQVWLSIAAESQTATERWV